MHGWTRLSPAALFLWVSPVWLAPSALAGQEVPDSSRVVPLEPIEVWVVQEKSQARRAETFSLFTESEMRRSEEISPYEFFKNIPGVNVTQGLALGFGLRNPVAGRVQIRGIGRKAGPTDFRGRGVSALMDGVPDFSVTHGHPLPDMFSRSYVNEIEVIKGPSSVRHGWAQAGAVLMRSRDPQRPGSSGYAAASFGAFSTTQDLLHYNNRWSDGFIQVSGAARHSDGHRPNSATDAYDGRIRFAHELGESANVVASLRGGTNQWEIPGPVGGEPGVGGDNDWYVADLGTRVELSDRWDLTAKVWRFDADVVFEDGLKEPNQAWGSRVKAEGAAWEGGAFTLGTDLMRYSVGRGTDEEVDLIDFTTEVAPYIWINHEARAGNATWILTGGIRTTFNEQFGEDVSPEVGVAFLPVPTSSIRARVAHGFRAPNPFEYAFGSAQNPDLEATDLWQYELGWNQRFGDHVTFDVVGWIQEGDNMIAEVFDETVQDTRNRNVGEFGHKGLEAQIEARLESGVGLGLAAATMDLQNDTALVPLNTVDAWLGYDGGAFWARADASWVTELHQRDDLEQRLPNYVLANLSLGYRLDSGLGFRIRVENLLDEQYELFSGWPMPGTGVYGGIDWVF